MKGLSPKGTDPKESLQQETKTLLNYFFIGISLPNEAFWVNLRPDVEDNIIDRELAETDLGKIFLEADLQLKKDTANFTSPQTLEGKEYWDKLYKKAEELYGSENITIPTLTRPWIVPDEIIIRESSDNAYIYKATLKVMLEQDYLKDSSTYNFKDERSKALNEYSSQLIRETIIPKLTKEINSSKRYAPLRQVYYSLILAQWFKQKFYGKSGVYSYLIDRHNLNGLTSKTSWSKTTYFNAYKTSFQQGEYNIKEPVYTPTGQIIRSYMSGGVALQNTIASSAVVPGSIKRDVFNRDLLDLSQNKIISTLAQGGTVSSPFDDIKILQKKDLSVSTESAVSATVLNLIPEQLIQGMDTIDMNKGILDFKKELESRFAGEGINFDELFRLYAKNMVGISDYLKKLPELQNHYCLGLHDRKRGLFDALVDEFNLKTYFDAYEDFKITLKGEDSDPVNSKALVEKLVAQQAPVVFFVPRGIFSYWENKGDKQSDNDKGVTKTEMELLVEKFKDNKEALRNVVFVFELYETISYGDYDTYLKKFQYGEPNDPQIIRGIFRLYAQRNASEGFKRLSTSLNQGLPANSSTNQAKSAGSPVATDELNSALLKKTKPVDPGSLMGGGIDSYVQERPHAAYQRIYTTDILSEDLPSGYSTLPGGEFKHEPLTLGHIAASLSEIKKAEVVFPDTDIFLASKGHNGSAGVVRLGFLKDSGRSVAVKIYYKKTVIDKEADERYLLNEYRAGQMVYELGLGPMMHGLYEKDGRFGIVMDIVPGDDPGFMSKYITERTIRDLFVIEFRLYEHGLSMEGDFQFFITPEGHIQIIDPAALFFPSSSSESRLRALGDHALPILISARGDVQPGLVNYIKQYKPELFKKILEKLERLSFERKNAPSTRDEYLQSIIALKEVFLAASSPAQQKQKGERKSESSSAASSPFSENRTIKKMKDFFAGFSKKQILYRKLSNAIRKNAELVKIEDILLKIFGENKYSFNDNLTPKTLEIYQLYPEGFARCIDAGFDLKNELRLGEVTAMGDRSIEGAQTLKELAKVFQFSQEKGKELLQTTQDKRRYTYARERIWLEKDYGEDGVRLARVAEKAGFSEVDISNIVLLTKITISSLSDIVQWLEEADSQGKNLRDLVNDLKDNSRYTTTRLLLEQGHYEHSLIFGLSLLVNLTDTSLPGEIKASLMQLDENQRLELGLALEGIQPIDPKLSTVMFDFIKDWTYIGLGPEYSGFLSGVKKLILEQAKSLNPHLIVDCWLDLINTPYKKIHSSPDRKANFELFCRELIDAIGKDAIIPILLERLQKMTDKDIIDYTVSKLFDLKNSNKDDNLASFFVRILNADMDEASYSNPNDYVRARETLLALLWCFKAYHYIVGAPAGPYMGMSSVNQEEWLGAILQRDKNVLHRIINLISLKTQDPHDYTQPKKRQFVAPFIIMALQQEPEFKPTREDFNRLVVGLINHYWENNGKYDLSIDGPSNKILLLYAEIIAECVKRNPNLFEVLFAELQSPTLYYALTEKNTAVANLVFAINASIEKSGVKISKEQVLLLLGIGKELDRKWGQEALKHQFNRLMGFTTTAITAVESEGGERALENFKTVLLSILFRGINLSGENEHGLTRRAISLLFSAYDLNIAAEKILNPELHSYFSKLAHLSEEIGISQATTRLLIASLVIKEDPIKFTRATIDNLGKYKEWLKENHDLSVEATLKDLLVNGQQIIVDFVMSENNKTMISEKTDLAQNLIDLNASEDIVNYILQQIESTPRGARLAFLRGLRNIMPEAEMAGGTLEDWRMLLENYVADFGFLAQNDLIKIY
ncbi:hypothetical protein D4R78_08615, partial [bacterium]